MWNQTPGEGSVGGRRVLQVPLHHDVATEHDLAHRLSVGRHLAHRLRVEHRHPFLQRVAHALAISPCCIGPYENGRIEPSCQNVSLSLYQPPRPALPQVNAHFGRAARSRGLSVGYPATIRTAKLELTRCAATNLVLIGFAPAVVLAVPACERLPGASRLARPRHLQASSFRHPLADRMVRTALSRRLARVRALVTVRRPVHRMG